MLIDMGYSYFIIENTSSFKPRDVQIIYGKDPKQQFELLTEIGR